MADEYEGIWRRHIVRTNTDFSFFYMKVRKRKGDEIEASGVDVLGEFDVKGKTTPGLNMTKIYNNGITLKYECLSSDGDSIQGNWRIGTEVGTFCMVDVNESEDKKRVLGKILLECEEAVMNNKISEHRQQFPFSPKF